MFKLECSVQNYAWGRLGHNSTVAKLHGGEIDEKKPYAEVSPFQLGSYIFLALDGIPSKWAVEIGGIGSFPCRLYQRPSRVFGKTRERRTAILIQGAVG